MQIYGVRIAAMIVSAGVWVALALFLGIFTVAMVIMVGAAVGNAHRLLPNMHRPHLANAISLSLLGGLFVDAFRPQDLLYYLIAIAAAIRFARRHVTSRRRAAD